MIGFFFCLRISGLGNLRENDLVFRKTDEGMALAIRIRKSKTDQGPQGALRSLLPTDALLRPATSATNWFRVRGWGIESDRFLFPKMRLRGSRVLKFPALSNDVPVECISTHSLRAGGTTTMSHACYGLLEVEEWGRWKSSCCHGYLWYDMHTMRGVGKDMAVATGLFEFTKLKPSQTKTATFRSGGKKKKDATQSQSSFPDTRNIPPQEITEALSKDITQSANLWYLLDNPTHSCPEDLPLFDDQNVVFYARQGRIFTSELLALGNFKKARGIQRSWERSQSRIAGFSSPETEFSRLLKDLNLFHHHREDVPAPQPFSCFISIYPIRRKGL